MGHLGFLQPGPPPFHALHRCLLLRHMARIQPAAYSAAKRAKQLELRPSSRQQCHRFQAYDANSDTVELEAFLATATDIKKLLGGTAVNDAWDALRFTAVADDAAPTTQRAASARPSTRRPRLSAEEQQRAAAEAARKQRFSKSYEDTRLTREMDAARAKQRASRKPGTTWPPEMAMQDAHASQRLGPKALARRALAAQGSPPSGGMMEASFTSSYNSPNPRVRRPMTAARPDRNPPFRSPGRPITATLSPRTRRSIAPSPPVRDTRPWSGIASWGSPRSPGSWDEASISRPQSARSRPQSPRSPSSPSRSPWVGDLGDQPYHCRQAGAWTVAPNTPWRPASARSCR